MDIIMNQLQKVNMQNILSETKSNRLSDNIIDVRYN